MIKSILNSCHVSLTDVSELSKISRVSLELYINLYETNQADFINNKGIVLFFKYLSSSNQLSKANVLYFLIKGFSGIGTYEDRLINSYIEKMNKNQKNKLLADLSQNINGGAYIIEDDSSIAEEKAFKIWETYYGNYDIVCDFAGRIMKKDAYGKENALVDLSEQDAIDLKQEGEGSYYCGWNLHHMMPKGKGGPDSDDNLIPVQYATNEMASDKTSYVIDDRTFEVKRTRGKKKPFYAIYDKSTGDFLIGFEPKKDNLN